MGLINITPTIRIEANNKDITDIIKERFVSLKITDESEYQSDIAEITLADHKPDARIKMPPTGAELRIWVGYDEKATDMGLWIVDEIRLAGPPDSMTLVARAAPFMKSMKGRLALTSHRNRTWPAGTTIGGMVKKMADKSKLEAKVSSTMAGIVLPHIAQINQSDLDLLTKLIPKYFGIATVKNGAIVVTSLAESKTGLTNSEIPPITLVPSDVTSYQTSVKSRGQYGKVIAKYRDYKTSTDKQVVVGDEEPVLRLPFTLPNMDSAYNSAKAKYMNGKRGLQEVSLTLPGRTDIFAERRLVLTGFRDELSGEWKIKRVEHQIDQGGYSCSVTLAVNITNEDIPPVSESDESEDDEE
ncbi:MAG: phage late control D family protein [Candidatus Margulisiibacteriota bacterium]